MWEPSIFKKGYSMITLNLNLSEVNTVLQALGAAPYAQVAEVIQTIRDQATPQVAKAQAEQRAAEASAAEPVGAA